MEKGYGVNNFWKSFDHEFFVCGDCSPIATLWRSKSKIINRDGTNTVSQIEGNHDDYID